MMVSGGYLSVKLKVCANLIASSGCPFSMKWLIESAEEWAKH